MRLTSIPSSVALFLTAFLTFLPHSAAIRMIESNSLNSCQQNSNFTATLFDVVFTPNNRSLAFNVVGVSSIQGNVTAELEVIAYGYTAVKQTINPCEMNLDSLCPMNTGQINIQSNIMIDESIIKIIPAITYNIPDLDGQVRIYINNTDTNQSVACVEADLSNGKTVDQKAVGWVTAVIAGLGLLASAVTSGLGHSNTAAHVAANALSLFGYLQGQALFGMTAVDMPPIVQSWTQNFQWSMGLIRVGFLQDLATWYQRSTGGKPSQLLSNLSSTSVQVQKRSVGVVNKLTRRAFEEIVRRTNSGDTTTQSNQVQVVRGIERVGFRARIELTNIFLTGLIFFVIFVMFTVIGVALFKAYCEFAAKSGWMKGDKFQEFRNGWKVVLRGIMFRLVLIGFPQICVLCLWELTKRDSAAEVVLALMFFVFTVCTMAWASLKVIRMAKRSVDMHKNPAYILYSDPAALNKWGFLYVQFRATAYYFTVPLLLYVLVKAAVIGFGQTASTVQGIAILIIEAVALIAVCTLRPYMDRKTNIFNISIAVINFINAVFLLVFTKIFSQPVSLMSPRYFAETNQTKGIVTGVMGVVFFILNCFFALVLLVMVLVASIYAMASKNPDTRYQPMRDDRGSFIKSQSQMTTELDALGATARGDMKTGYKTRDLDEDDDSFSSGSLNRQQHDAAGVALPPSTANSSRVQFSRDGQPIESNMPMLPGDGASRRGPPPQYGSNAAPYHDNGYNQSTNETPLMDARSNSLRQMRSNNTSPAPRGYGYESQPYGRSASMRSNPGAQQYGAPQQAQQYPGQPQYGQQQQYRQQNTGSPWQRGAGYDH